MVYTVVGIDRHRASCVPPQQPQLDPKPPPLNAVVGLQHQLELQTPLHTAVDCATAAAAGLLTWTTLAQFPTTIVHPQQ